LVNSKIKGDHNGNQKKRENERKTMLKFEVATLNDKVVFRIYPTHDQRAFERSSEEE
jgi:hypothetical protein